MARLEAYYDEVATRHGYHPVDFDLGDLPAAHLRRKFAAVDGREAVANALDRPTMVTTGVSTTGPPHLGTLGQILTAVSLQAAGLDVQFVIADLEPYHDGADLDAVRALAGRYRSLITGLGFDADRGVLRTQEEATGVMHSAAVLAPYYAPEEDDYFPDAEPTAFEAELSAAYDAADAADAADATGGDASGDDGPAFDGPTSEAASSLSGLLHAVDFVHPLLAWDYDQVVVMLGIDEHALTLGTRRFLERIPVEGTLAGLHTRLIKGVDGHPKMSKRIPASVVDLSMPAATIRDRIVHPAGDYDDPADSAVFQMMCLASTYGPAELDRRRDACAAGGEAWEDAKREYAEFVVECAELWRSTAG